MIAFVLFIAVKVFMRVVPVIAAVGMGGVLVALTKSQHGRWYHYALAFLPLPGLPMFPFALMFWVLAGASWFTNVLIQYR